MQKLSKILAAVLCITLMLVCVVPASAAGQGQSQSKGVDVMLMVDDTVSMQFNDPNRIASVALQLFVERLPGEGTRIGMATYDDDILTSTDPGTGQAMVDIKISADKDVLRDFAKNGLTQNGHFTDLPGALYYAVQQLRSLPATDNIPAIIAVSDGENDFISDAARLRSDNMLKEVLAAGIPVYLIVIHASGKGDVTEYMQGIANGTGGEARFVDSGDEIDTFLKDIVKKIYDYDDPDDEFYDDVSQEPKDWTFSLPVNVFEATVELTHEKNLDLKLFGPDGEIFLKGNQSVLMSTVQSGDALKTFIRLAEPDEGDYTLRLSSPDGRQFVLGEIIRNNEIYVKVDLSADSVEPGEDVEVTASLMRGGVSYTDLEFANLTASISIDGSQAEMERDDDKGVFRYTMSAPSQEGDVELMVSVDGQKSFHRDSDAATLTISSSPGSGPSSSPNNNNTVSVQVEFSANPAKPGEDVEVTASLMSRGKPYTDLAIADLTATILIDGNQAEMERDEKAGIFRYSLTAPDEAGDLKVEVTVAGQGGFRESSGTVKLTIRGPSIWVIILAIVLVIVIILIAVVLVLKFIKKPKGNYIQLRVSLTVQYFDDMHKHIWEKYVTTGSLYTKRNPHESLGGLLRMQSQDYGDIPEYFDKILLTGMRYGNNQLCIEVKCDIDTPSGPMRMNQRIDIPNGMGMDDMSSMGFSSGMASVNLVFPDNRQLEIKLQ